MNWIVFRSSYLIRVLFVYAHELVLISFCQICFMIWFVAIHELYLILFFIFDSYLVCALSRTLYGRVAYHVWFVLCSCLVTNCIWFCSSCCIRIWIVSRHDSVWRRSSPDLILILFVFAHELYLISFFIFDSCFIRALSRICYGGIARLIWFLSCSDYVLNWIGFRSSYLIRVVFICCYESGKTIYEPWCDSYLVHAMSWTCSNFVLHIWIVFSSRFYTNLLWRQRSLPDHHIWIVIWFRLCSEPDMAHSYRIWTMILFVSCHKWCTNTVWIFGMMVWFILCSLWYRWCVAMLCGYDSWIYAWYEPWSDAYMHRVWFGRCMVRLHRLFGSLKTKTVLRCMTCTKGRFEWCGMYVDYAPMRCLIALRVSYTRLIVDGYCIIGSFMPILMV